MREVRVIDLDFDWLVGYLSLDKEKRCTARPGEDVTISQTQFPPRCFLVPEPKVKITAGCNRDEWSPFKPGFLLHPDSIVIKKSHIRLRELRLRKWTRQIATRISLQKESCCQRRKANTRPDWTSCRRNSRCGRGSSW